MNTPWDLQFTVDAAGADGHRVGTRSSGPGARPHLIVRTGPLIVYAVDGDSVTTMAQAWARASVTARKDLPTITERRRPAKRQPGAAYPVGDVVVEGKQHFDVIPPHFGQHHAVVTTGWLTVRVHDQFSLDTHVRAWKQASAVGQRVLRTRPVPFARLLEAERRRAIELARRPPQRRSGPRRKR
jgi:hypothetical protein